MTERSEVRSRLSPMSDGQLAERVGGLTEYLAANEFDLAGRVNRVHAIASYGGELWMGSVCGLPAQPYPLTGQRWAAVPASERCARCAVALAG